MRILWSPTSFQKIEEIVEYISSDDADSAVSFLKKLEKRIRSLEKADAIAGNDPRANWIREIVIRSPYLIIYEIKEDRIHILTVRQTRYDPENNSDD